MNSSFFYTQQNDSWNCGVFVSQYLKFLLKEEIVELASIANDIDSLYNLRLSISQDLRKHNI